MLFVKKKYGSLRMCVECALSSWYEHVVVDTLSRLSMISVAYVEEERKELVKYVHKLARSGVHLMSIPGSGVTFKERGSIFFRSGY